jgi:hypothetical protein
MSKTEERQLRAYVFPFKIDMLNVAPSGQPEQEQTQAHRSYPHLGPVAVVILKNTGQTPAYSVAISSDLTFGAVNGPVPTHLREGPLPSAMNIPRDDATSHARRFERPLTSVEINAMKNGTHALFLVGLITYFDTFGKRRWTRFAYRHNGATGAIGITTEVTGCEEGNEADRDGGAAAPDLANWDRGRRPHRPFPPHRGDAPEPEGFVPFAP